jgi:acyl-[acyl-carrier-protein] desaturase
MSGPLTQTQLLLELEPVVESNLNRHLNMAKEWFPHEYVPWSDGRNFDGPLGGDAWSVEDSQMSDVARSALIVNLLTEDNLPSYHHEIATLFGREAAWGDWVHRWTAEEGRHGIAIRDYLLTTRAVDPVQLEQLRMDHMSTGYTAQHDDRSWPPASRTATPGRSPATRSATSCSPGSRPTRTCTWSSTGTCSAPRSSSTRARRCARSPTW